MKPDIFFLSYDEPNAEANWLALQKRFPAAKRVQGIKGIAQAHQTCSELAETDFYFLVDADNEVHPSFNFDLPEAHPDSKTVYVWRCLNPVNGLKYGYGAIKLFPKGLFSKPLTGADITTSVAPRYKIIHEVASTTVFNSSSLQAWRSAFRECAKLSSQGIKSQKAGETAERLKTWTEVKFDVPHADWALKGAQQGKRFGESYEPDSEEFLRINDYEWLNTSFKRQEKIQQLLLKEKFSPDEVSKTFCVLPWVHLSTRPNGHMRVCCTANASSVGKTNDKEFGGEVGIVKNKNGRPANLNHTDLLEGWNNDYMKNVRLQMLDGKKPASCLKCYKEEAAGHRSKRNWETAYWWSRVEPDKILKETGLDGEIPPKLYYIDLRLGTKCNLKCVMCSPHDSSMWVSDWNKLYPQLENSQLKQTMTWQNKGQVDGASYNWHKDNPTFWTQLYDQIPHMKQLYFAGGESTIIKEHYDLLEECIRRGEAHHIELRYNSNGVEMPEKLFKLWEHFKRVRFHFSIDSIGDMNSYIRYPSQWEQIEKQLWMLDRTGDHVEVTIACAVQILNIHYIPDFIRWKLDQGFKKINVWPLGAGLINFHFVYHPPHLNVKVLPEEFKLKTTEKLNRFCDELEQRFSHNKDFVSSQYGIPRIKGMVSFMNSENWSNRMPEFIEYIEKMDQIRGTDFKKVFPEMAELIEPKPEAVRPRPPMKRLAEFLFGFR